MSNAPWFPWYPKDFETDEAVILMSNQQRGVYLKFMNHSWLHGGIPIEEEALARLANEPLATFRELWPGISVCWVNGGNGRLVNPRQELERAKLVAKTESRREAGKRGAKAKHCQSFASGKSVAMPEFCQSNARVLPVAKPSYSDTDTDTDTESKTPLPPLQETASEWLAPRLSDRHPKTGDRTAVEHAVVAILLPLDSNAQWETARTIDQRHERRCKSKEWRESRFVPKLSNWLRDGGWRDNTEIQQDDDLQGIDPRLKAWMKDG